MYSCCIAWSFEKGERKDIWRLRRISDCRMKGVCHTTAAFLPQEQEATRGSCVFRSSLSPAGGVSRQLTTTFDYLPLAVWLKEAAPKRIAEGFAFLYDPKISKINSNLVSPTSLMSIEFRPFALITQLSRETPETCATMMPVPQRLRNRCHTMAEHEVRLRFLLRQSVCMEAEQR